MKQSDDKKLKSTRRTSCVITLVTLVNHYKQLQWFSVVIAYVITVQHKPPNWTYSTTNVPPDRADSPTPIIQYYYCVLSLSTANLFS